MFVFNNAEFKEAEGEINKFLNSDVILEHVAQSSAATLDGPNINDIRTVLTIFYSTRPSY